MTPVYSMADAAREIAAAVAKAERAEERLRRIRSLAETFRENAASEWTGIEIAHIITANLEDK